MKYHVRIADDERDVRVDGASLELEGTRMRADIQPIPGTPVHLVTLGDAVHAVVVKRGPERGTFELTVDGYRLVVEALDERTRAIRALAGARGSRKSSASVVAPMPGLIVRVAVSEGDEVHAGQGVLVMEAMKMENELRTGGAGRVKKIHVAAGTAVERGTLLLELE